MTPESLTESYFNWLYGQVASLRLRNPARTHWALLRQLHQKEFVWFVPNDDNRATDGRYLRYDFVDSLPPQEQAQVPDGWFNLGCSMLEMIVALSRRLAFITGDDARWWFWQLIDNLGLRGYTDARPGDPHRIDRILTRINERTYDDHGNGGLFPAIQTDVDQRQVELWYQMNHYLLERG